MFKFLLKRKLLTSVLSGLCILRGVLIKYSYFKMSSQCHCRIFVNHYFCVIEKMRIQDKIQNFRIDPLFWRALSWWISPYPGGISEKECFGMNWTSIAELKNQFNFFFKYFLRASQTVHYCIQVFASYALFLITAVWQKAPHTLVPQINQLVTSQFLHELY